MIEKSNIREFRFKGGSSILSYIRQFSATEKAVFGVLFLVAIITALWMAQTINSSFMVRIPAHGGELREGLIGLPRTINPVLAVTDVDKDISSLVYSGLMRSNEGELITDMAKSYKISSDGLTYTFILKPDLRFHDGMPLTAEDVAFTVQKIQDPALKSPRKADWANVGVKVISSTEIEFSLKQAYSPFLGNTTVGIIPKHIWKDVSVEQFIFSQYNIEPTGSGPYKMSSISRDNGGIPQNYVLSAWRNFSGDKPKIDKIVFNFYADEDKALTALLNGSIDSLPSISSIDASTLVSNSGEKYTVTSVPLPRIFGIFMNQNQAPIFADKSVRTALEMAVDRKALIDVALGGFGQPIDSPLPPGMFESSEDVNDEFSTSTIEKARAILEKNGWKLDTDGIYQKKEKTSSLTLSFDLYTADTQDLKQTAFMLKQAWSAVGAEVEIKVFEPSDLYQNVIRTRKYDALLFGEFIGKDRDLYAFWHSSQRNAPGLNIAMYANSKADKLLEDIRITNDESARLAKYKQFDELVRTDIPAIFLYAPDFIYAIPKSLKGFSLSSVTVPSDRWNSIGDWYVTTEKVWNFLPNVKDKTIAEKETPKDPKTNNPESRASIGTSTNATTTKAKTD